MHVAIVSTPNTPVPPESYGGIERGVFELSTHLVNTGHDVTVLASGDSVVEQNGINLIPIAESALFQNPPLPLDEYEEAVLQAEQTVIDVLPRIDADVLNLRWERARIAKSLSNLAVPSVVSFSCTPNDQIHRILDDMIPGVPYTAHTHAHKAALGGQPEIQVVPYGIDMSRATPSERPLTQTDDVPAIDLLRQLKAEGRNYLVHVAGIKPEKGQRTSIEIARRAGVPLIIAGQTTKNKPDSAAYFEEVIAPLVDDETVFFYGPANDDEKYELKRYAVATLFCTGIERPEFFEAFGRVLAESTAVGTPVIGYRGSGSFTELIPDYKMGLGFDNIDEAVENVAKVANIDRVECARLARETLSFDRFLQGMTQLFEKAVTTELIAT